MFLESSDHEEHHYCHDADAEQGGGSHTGSGHAIAISRALILPTVELNGLLNLDWRIYRDIANSFQDENKLVRASICDWWTEHVGTVTNYVWRNFHSPHLALTLSRG